MNWLKTLLLILALGHVVLGAYALYTPQAAADLVALQPGTAGAVGELRALFGGLIIAMGLVILRGSIGGDRGKQWLLAASVAYFGLLLGRVASLVLDGAVAHTLAAGAIELLLGVILFYAAMDIAQPGAGRAGAAAPAEPRVEAEPPSPATPKRKADADQGASDSTVSGDGSAAPRS